MSRQGDLISEIRHLRAVRRYWLHGGMSGPGGLIASRERPGLGDAWRELVRPCRRKIRRLQRELRRRDRLELARLGTMPG